MIVIIILCILASINAQNIQKNYQNLQCQGIETIYGVAYGNQDWIGVNQIENKLTNIYDDLDILIDLAQNTFDGEANISEGLNDINKQINQLNNKNGISYIYENNPLGQNYKNNNFNQNDIFDINNAFSYINEEQQPSTFFASKYSPFYYIYSDDKFAKKVDSEIYPISQQIQTIEIKGSQMAQIGDKGKEAIQNGIEQDVINPTVTNNLMVCKEELGGDGEILQYYNVQDYLLILSLIELNLEGHMNYVDQVDNLPFNEIKTIISTTLSSMAQMRDDNSISFDNIEFPEHFSLKQALLNLNTYIQNCNIQQDQWVQDIKDCEKELSDNISSPSSNFFDKNQKNNNNLQFIKGECYWIGGTQLSQNSEYIINSNQINVSGRYQLCPSADDQLQSILKWRDEKSILFDTKYNETAQLQTTVDDYIQYVQNFTNNVSLFFNQTSEILDKITDKQNGIFVNSNCLILGQQMDNFYGQMCYKFVPNIITQAKYFIAISVLLFIGQYAIYYFVMKIGWNKYVSQQIEKNGQSNEIQATQQQQESENNKNTIKIEQIKNQNTDSNESNRNDQKTQPQTNLCLPEFDVHKDENQSENLNKNKNQGSSQKSNSILRNNQQSNIKNNQKKQGTQISINIENLDDNNDSEIKNNSIGFIKNKSYPIIFDNYNTNKKYQQQNDKKP
ncbi:hypothetical protein PPERSA_04878 [Pseudocohnilembus persalinus]|uniref:Transmembrane protein n=1 Tax=Pseudocohnilembus persalinus TaxID=266149 RepID=A0A0V0QJT0_PSEPJ|nr:hypothetical protein PPERSA_04878 [Pseudocohnilembus persalinus]|eukprot:KRX02256.1 hypothetical protein PPERSA_04878 [Pseudocohnilembus persalinus]